MFTLGLRNKNCAFIILGIAFGLLSFFSPGSLFIFFAVLMLLFFINRLPDKTERRFILTLFLSAFGARIILTLLTMFFSIVTRNFLNYASYGFPNFSTPYIIGDSGYYSLRSLFMSMHYLDKPIGQNTVKWIYLGYGFSGFLYVLATFFTIFGYSPISSRFINCFLGSLIIILVYSIVKNIFNERPARLAAILTAFFPSLFLWSTTNLKETICIFAVCLMLWSLVKFQRTKSIYYLIITALSILIQGSVRSSYRGEFLFITVAIILSYIFYLFLSNLSLKRRSIIFFIIFMIGGSLIFTEKDKVKSSIAAIAQRMLVHHRGVVGTGGICYKLLPDEYYTLAKNSINFSDFLKMLGKGWFHIMLEPLPGSMQSMAMLFSFPQMLLWYFLIPFAILGAGISLRHRFRESIILIVYFLVITSALAVTGGNIGTTFRLRDINTPIILIFSSIGLTNTFNYLNFKRVERIKL